MTGPAAWSSPARLIPNRSAFLLHQGFPQFSRKGRASHAGLPSGSVCLTYSRSVRPKESRFPDQFQPSCSWAGIRSATVLCPAVTVGAKNPFFHRKNQSQRAWPKSLHQGFCLLRNEGYILGDLPVGDMNDQRVVAGSAFYFIYIFYGFII